MQMLEGNETKLRLYGIPILRAMLTTKMNTVPVAHRLGGFHVLERCLKYAAESASDDTSTSVASVGSVASAASAASVAAAAAMKSRATSIIQAAAAVDSLMQHSDLRNRIGKKQGARLHATLMTCKETLPDDTNLQALVPVICKKLEWCLAPVPAQDEGTDYAFSAADAEQQVSALRQRLETEPLGPVESSDLSDVVKHLHQHVSSPDVVVPALTSCLLVLRDSSAQAVQLRAAMADAGVIPAAVKVLMQYAHGTEHSCKELCMKVLCAFLEADSPASTDEENAARKTSQAAAALTSEMGDSPCEARSLWHALISTISMACIFDRFVSAEEQETRLILPAFCLIECLLAAPLDSLVPIDDAEDLRIAIHDAAEYRPESEAVSTKRLRLVNSIAAAFQEWGEPPWVVVTPGDEKEES